MMSPTLTYGRISAVQIILEEKNKAWLANAVKEIFLSKDYKQNKECIGVWGLSCGYECGGRGDECARNFTHVLHLDVFL